MIGEKNILVVDGSHAMRNVVKEMLRDIGLRWFVEANDGAAAIQEVQRSAPALIITDLDMPMLDGIEFTRFIRSQRTSVPVVMMSGNPRFDAVAQALRAGVDAFVVKPFTAETLFSHVQWALRRTAPKSAGGWPASIRPILRSVTMTPRLSSASALAA